MMQLLADEESRALLRRLFAYRALGPEHVHLPSDADDPLPAVSEAAKHEVAEGSDARFDLRVFDVDGIRMEANVLNVCAGFFELQYFFRRGDVRIEPEDSDVVIDAGSCFGDTALVFAQRVGAKGRVHAFEPMPSQIAVMERNFARNPELAARITSHAFALSDRSGQRLTFSDVGPGARPDDQGTLEVVTSTIDELDLKPTFIKMDIEGGETKALLGARRTLEREAPKLAISIYHSLDDLVGIAPLIHSINPAYRFYLDHHTTHDEETVLYAAAS